MVLRNACQTVAVCPKLYFQTSYIFDKYFVYHSICPSYSSFYIPNYDFCEAKWNSLIRFQQGDRLNGLA